MKLISMKICPYVQQVRGFLEAKDLAYEVEHIEYEDRPQWLYQVSPDGGEVPVLVTDEGTPLFQSDSIVQYIDEAFGEPLLPGTPLKKAQFRAWGLLASEHYLTQCATQRSTDEAIFNERMEDLRPILAAMEAHISLKPFYNGSALSFVDFSWLPIIHRVSIIQKHSGYDFLAGFPKLKVWQKELLSTGFAERSVTSDFEKIFKDFYLNDETFLGRMARS